MASRSKKNRRFPPEKKAAILRRHLKDKVPVSDLCDEYKIQPSQFYLWQKQLLENMEAALEDGKKRQARNSRETRLARENKALEDKLTKKDTVIAEISEEFVKLKKANGEP